jgi:hypothetical protein
MMCGPCKKCEAEFASYYYPPPLPTSLWGPAKMYRTHSDVGKGGDSKMMRFGLILTTIESDSD